MSLAELGELTALWLEGEIGQAPTNLGRPAGETAELIPVLAAVNQAGFVTDCSQPGMSKPWQGSILGWDRAIGIGLVPACRGQRVRQRAGMWAAGQPC